MSDFPNEIRKDLLFDLSFALRFRTFLKWKKKTATSEQTAEQLVAHLERANYVVMRGPRSREVASFPGPSLYPEVAEAMETRMARRHIHQMFLERVQQDVENGLEPEAARAYGNKLVTDIRRHEQFRDLPEDGFKAQLRDFGGMVLQLSSYKGKLQPVQAHAFQNIWEALYSYSPKEL